MELDDLDNINVGDVFMWIGTVMMTMGGAGLAIYAIYTAFSVSIPLGLLITTILGFLIGGLGYMLENAN